MFRFLKGSGYKWEGDYDWDLANRAQEYSFIAESIQSKGYLDSGEFEEGWEEHLRSTKESIDYALGELGGGPWKINENESSLDFLDDILILPLDLRPSLKDLKKYSRYINKILNREWTFDERNPTSTLFRDLYLNLCELSGHIKTINYNSS